MMIDAEYEEIDDGMDQLDLAGDDSLPWLEADVDDDRSGAVDRSQIIGLIAVLAAVALGVFAIVYVVSNYNRGPMEIADGSLIEAEEGPYKQRPADAGGRVFAGTGDVAPGVGQGEMPDARMADSTGAETGDQDLNIAMPPIGADAERLGDGSAAEASPAQGAAADAQQPAQAASSSAPPSTSGSAASVEGVGVQLAAYSSRARAQKGWRELQRKSKALNGFEPRILEGISDNATVFRLQAVAPTRARADELCTALKREGLDCQVKP